MDANSKTHKLVLLFSCGAGWQTALDLQAFHRSHHSLWGGAMRCHETKSIVKSTLQMRQLLSVVLALGTLTRLLEADTAAIVAQIAAMPQGAKIELRLKNKEKLHGARGAANDSGFTLTTSHAERQIAFDDIASVKPYKSHTTRNVLIIVGVGVVATLGIILAVALRCGPLGCNSKL